MTALYFSTRVAARSGAEGRVRPIRSGHSGASRRPRGRLRGGILALFCALLAPALADAQGDTGAAAEAAPAAQPSVIELKAAAYDAQQKALAAQADAERVRGELEEAQRAAESASPPPPPAPAPVAVPPPVATPVALPAAGPVVPVVPVVQKAGATAEEVDALEEAVQRAQADADAARTEAEEAKQEAREAKREFEEFKAKHAQRFARKGVFVAASVFYAPEIFDTSLSVENGKGLGLTLGYRIHEHFELSLQSDRVTGFEFSGSGLVGEVQGWTATANGKAFLLTGSFQPFIGLGIGAFYATLDVHDNLGNRDDDSQAAGLFKFNGGFDYYISERLAVTADAAIYLPGGDLSALTFSTLGGGLKLRF